MFKKKILISFGIIVVVIGVGLGITKLEKNKISNNRNGEISFKYIANLDDDRNAIGTSHNVFSAKITKIVEHTNIQGVPITFFEATVVNNIKGDLEGTVRLMQLVGYVSTEDGEEKLAALRSDNKLMALGETYLFATRYDEKTNSYVVSTHPNMSKLLSNDNKLDISVLGKIAEQDEKTLKWKEAYKNEILLESDVETGNIKNSYESLNKRR